MYNLYNFEPRQQVLNNYRKNTGIYYRAAETGVLFLILASSFLWLFV